MPFCSVKEETIVIPVNFFMHNGFKITYVKTNYGNLFIARTLISYLKGQERSVWQTDKYVHPTLSVKLKDGGKTAPICVGMKGAEQIFADHMDYSLFQKLKLHNIYEGELPYAEDIKLVRMQTKVVSDNDVYILRSKDSFESQLNNIQQQLLSLREENEQLKKRIVDIERQQRINRMLFY